MELLAVTLALVGIGVALFIPLFVEAMKHPWLRLERADDANSPLGFRIVHVRVINEPLGGWLGQWLIRNVATSCKVDVSFRSLSDSATLDIPGRWSGAPEPFTYLSTPTGQPGVVFDPMKAPAASRIDLHADAEGEVLGIAIKTDGDAEAYGF